MEITNILLATDGSDESEKALDYTLYLAPVFGSRVLALYVSEIHFPMTSLFPVYEDAIVEIAEKTEKRFEESFTVMSERFKEKGIPFSSKIVRDGAVEGIIKTAGEEDAGLIVMGKRGQGFIESSLIGSNTAKVIANTDVPVLAVRSKGEVHSAHVKTLLVPVDISEPSVSALPEALSLAGRLGAEVIAVYVFWLNGNVYDVPPNLVDELIKSSQDKLAQWVETEKNAYINSGAGETEIKITSEVLHGISPAASLRDYAADNPVDLMVLKTHGRKGFSKLLYGSETKRIIMHSPCPVLTLK